GERVRANARIGRQMRVVRWAGPACPSARSHLRGEPPAYSRRREQSSNMSCGFQEANRTFSRSGRTHGGWRILPALRRLALELQSGGEARAEARGDAGRGDVADLDQAAERRRRHMAPAPVADDGGRLAREALAPVRAREGVSELGLGPGRLGVDAG